MKKINFVIYSFYLFIINRWITNIPFHFIRMVFFKPLLGKLGKNNTFLMDVLTDPQFGYDRQTLISINRCRVYCSALTLADITTGDGCRIRTDMLYANFINGI